MLDFNSICFIETFLGLLEDLVDAIEIGCFVFDVSSFLVDDASDDVADDENVVSIVVDSIVVLVVDGNIVDELVLDEAVVVLEINASVV